LQGRYVDTIKLVLGTIPRAQKSKQNKSKGKHAKKPDPELPPEYVKEVETELESVMDPGLRSAMKSARFAQLRRRLRVGKG
ncbi:MAG: hypothetical protein V1754_13905, partial [Pseudomonadota bacterium]